MTEKMKISIAMRIDNKDINGCWPWKGALNKDGYGTISLSEHVKKLAHRIIWEMIAGEIPDGVCVCHHCDNPTCVRFDHLFLGTRTDNMIDKCRKGRQPLSERRELAKEIRKRCKKRGDQAKLCKEFGISNSAMSRIIRNQMWKELS